MSRIPGPNEPDPQNERLRPFQGEGWDSLPDTTPDMIPPKYRDVPRTAGATVSGSGNTEQGPVTHSPAGREGGARVRVTERQ